MKMNSQKDNTLEANLERHRISFFQTIAKKLVKLEAGYVGDLNFMDGSPNMFWICKDSPGLWKLQDYLTACYGDKVGDGGGQLSTGSSVLAKYSADGRYYRARVQEVVIQEDDLGDSMYSICYVDYGNSELVSGLELMTWDPRLEALPEQAVACCLEDAPSLWREETKATWTLEQLEAFQRTMRRRQLKVRLGTDLGRDIDPRKARFEALVWLEGESLLQILKRQTVFADDLASWEPLDPGLESKIDKFKTPLRIKSQDFCRSDTLTPRLVNPELGLRKLQTEVVPSDVSISLRSPLNDGAAIESQKSLAKGDVPKSNDLDPNITPVPISTTVRVQVTIPHAVETPFSPFDSELFEFSKMKVEKWLIKQEIKSSETILSIPVEESKGDDDPNTISECNSDRVNFAEPMTRAKKPDM